jgi:quercetin dioxygenase-like cupin family protein
MTATKGFVVPASGGRHFDSPTPGRSFALKLLGRETGESIMMFEETVPAGTTSLFHLHRDSDEVAWVLAGEITFKIGDEVAVGGPGACAFMPRDVPHAWKNTGSETAQVLFQHPGRRERPRRGARGAPPGRRRRTRTTLPAPPLGSRRPKPALSKRWAGGENAAAKRLLGRCGGLHSPYEGGCAARNSCDDRCGFVHSSQP